MHDKLFTHQQAQEDHHLVCYAKRIGLDAEWFERDMSENTFLKQIEADYERSMEEHVTGTPTFYINAVRYTGATDVDSLLAAIEQADTEGRIRLPKSSGRRPGLLGRLRRRSNGSHKFITEGFRDD